MMVHKPRHLVTSGMLIITFLVSFAVFVERLELHKLMGFDWKIIRVIQGRIDRSNTRMMKVFTFLGSPLTVAVFVAASVIGLYRSGRRRESLGMLISNAIGVCFNEILKYMFRRKRPDVHRLVPAHGYSFPSGHAMGSVVFYGTLSYLLSRQMNNVLCKIGTFVMSLCMILLTGMSRIYLGVHYPSDVLSGYAAGGAWLSAFIKGFHAVRRKR